MERLVKTMLISYLEKKSAPSAEYVHNHVDIDLMEEYFFSGGEGEVKGAQSIYAQNVSMVHGGCGQSPPPFICV